MTARFVTKQPQAGFTLLELLISITLLGMLLVLLFGATLGAAKLGCCAASGGQPQLRALAGETSAKGDGASPPVPVEEPGTPSPVLAFQVLPIASVMAPMAARIGAGGLHAASLELDHTGEKAPHRMAQSTH